MADENAIEPGCGNVFADLGFEEPELELAKARLSGKIAEEIAAHGWTQGLAANVLHIDQPHILLLASRSNSTTLIDAAAFLPKRW